MFDCANMTASQKYNDHICMNVHVHVCNIHTIFSAKAAPISLTIFSATTLSSAVLTVKIQLTGEIITAWQNVRLCWKNTLLIYLV